MGRYISPGHVLLRRNPACAATRCTLLVPSSVSPACATGISIRPFSLAITCVTLDPDFFEATTGGTYFCWLRFRLLHVFPPSPSRSRVHAQPCGLLCLPHSQNRQSQVPRSVSHSGETRGEVKSAPGWEGEHFRVSHPALVRTMGMKASLTCCLPVLREATRPTTVQAPFASTIVVSTSC